MLPETPQKNAAARTTAPPRPPAPTKSGLACLARLAGLLPPAPPLPALTHRIRKPTRPTTLSYARRTAQVTLVRLTVPSKKRLQSARLAARFARSTILALGWFFHESHSRNR